MTMAICRNCGDIFSDKRAGLGYKTCLKCGAQDADLEKLEKGKRVAIPYNKGPYMLITSRKELTSLGKK
jgi:hypothetical protein